MSLLTIFFPWLARTSGSNTTTLSAKQIRFSSTDLNVSAGDNNNSNLSASEISIHKFPITVSYNDTRSVLSSKTITINSRGLLCKILLTKPKLQFSSSDRSFEFTTDKRWSFISSRSYEYIQYNRDYNFNATNTPNFTHNNQLRKRYE